MKIKIYLFRLAIAFTAFVCGISFYSLGQHFQSAPVTEEQKAESVGFAKIEEITYPPDVIEQANAPVLEQTDVAAASEEDTGCEYDGYGYYYVVGDLPGGFKDFYGVTLITRDFKTKLEDCPLGIPIPPEGSLHTERKYKFTQINMGNKQIAFETETIKGTSYKFIGKGKFMGAFEGRLIKMHNGKKIAESHVGFELNEKC